MLHCWSVTTDYLFVSPVGYLRDILHLEFRASCTRHQVATPLRVLIIEDSEDDTLVLLRELERAAY